MSHIAPSEPSRNESVLSTKQSLQAMLGLCLVTMLMSIDQTMVGTALPTVVAELNGFEFYAWVATASMLTSVITIPIFGRLGDYYGRKPFIVTSIALFTFCSVLCGMSGSMLQLVLARALQGIALGMLMGTSFTSIADLFPDPHVRLRWQAMFSAAYGISSGIGPTLGGFLTQYIGWRSIFFVNVPIGLLGFFIVWRCLPHIRQLQAPAMRLDWQGAVLVALGLGGLQLAVQFLPSIGITWPMLGLVLFTVVAFTGLVYWEKNHPAPLLPPELFRNKSLAALFFLSFFCGAIMFTLLFYAPLLFQGGFGFSPQKAGLLITPLVVFLTVGSILNGRIVTRVRNPNVMLYTGFSLLGICLLGIVFTHQGTPDLVIIGYMVVGGLGLGFIMPNLNIFAQETAGRSQLGIATAVVQSVRMIGAMLGLAVVGSLVTHYYTAGVRDTVRKYESATWHKLLEDPQLIVNVSARNSFLERLNSMGLDGTPFIEAARVSLVSAIHSGQFVLLLAVILALFWVRRLPPVRFSRVVHPIAPTGE
ncbi:MAG TPA: MDR family MFS transporter [Eoetvoesiella sp.]